eukprot:4257540-Pyramimonas_sp.AAC.1
MSVCSIREFASGAFWYHTARAMLRRVMARVSVDTGHGCDVNTSAGSLVSASRAWAAATCIAALSARHLAIGVMLVTSMLAGALVM